MRIYIRIALALATYFCPLALEAAAPLSNVSVLTGDQVVQILDDTVDWYRTLGAQQQTATQPSDLLILYANQQTADKVIALAFQLARANAELLSSEANSSDSAANTSAAQALSEQQQKLDAEHKAIQDEIETDRKLVAGGRKDLDAKLSELQGELDMVKARKNLLDTMTQFVSESDAKRAGASALKAHIDAIAVSIPAAGGAAAAGGSATPAPAAAAGSSTTSSAATTQPAIAHPESASDRIGIWDLATEVLRLSRKIGTIKAIDARTADLQQTFLKVRTKPLEQLRSYATQSDSLATQADTAGGTALKGLRDQFDTLAWLFKQTSDVLIPLSKEGVLLNQYRRNLSNWLEATERQYQDALVRLGIRIAVLAAMLAVVFAGAEIWRRAVLRYAHDPRRRGQLLMVRKVTTWILVVAIVGLTFVTELSTFATFAGLLTAGVAVAMQSVLVSIVGYFFLIGKYGIRVGDRVQIGTVTGEVIDLGLVRIHLMELSTEGTLGATGRVVAFANSIVFQSSGGLFKQISGVNFAWHETTLALPDGSDYAALKEKLLAAVNSVVKKYHDEIVRQTREIQKTTSSSAAALASASPQVQLRFSQSNVEALIRYPVELQHAAEIDERVSEAMLKAIRA